jgi:predicted amidohydrolase YtcJ
VLTTDYFNTAKVPDEALKRIQSMLTIVGGKVVYDSRQKPE